MKNTLLIKIFDHFIPSEFIFMDPLNRITSDEIENTNNQITQKMAEMIKGNIRKVGIRNETLHYLVTNSYC